MIASSSGAQGLRLMLSFPRSMLSSLPNPTIATLPFHTAPLRRRVETPGGTPVRQRVVQTHVPLQLAAGVVEAQPAEPDPEGTFPPAAHRAGAAAMDHRSPLQVTF